MLNIFLSGASSNNEFIVTLEGKENDSKKIKKVEIIYD